MRCFAVVRAIDTSPWDDTECYVVPAMMRARYRVGTSGTKSPLSYLSWGLLSASRTLNGALIYRQLLTRLQPLIDPGRQMLVWECRGIRDLAAEQFF